MVQHFRNKNNNIDEIKEGFTVIMPKKIRANLNFIPSHQFLIEHENQKEVIFSHLQ